MKPRKMKMGFMWAVVGEDGLAIDVFRTRQSARSWAGEYNGRVVRVRVTEAP